MIVTFPMFVKLIGELKLVANENTPVMSRTLEIETHREIEGSCVSKHTI